jgi:hypothetical protein
VFSELDNIIFPDGCEVIKVTSQHYVFPIFKCGRSSLTKSMESNGWTFVDESDIPKIQTPITIFLRDPRQRFISGVNTFLQHLLSKEKNLDQDTVLYFVNNYLFLNRHFSPQFFWLLNLSRFAGTDKLLSLNHLSDIKLLTDLQDDAEVDPITDELRNKIQKFNWEKLELYLYLDQILIDNIGKTMTILELLDHVKRDHKDLYDLVFRKTLNIVDILPKT